MAYKIRLDHENKNFMQCKMKINHSENRHKLEKKFNLNRIFKKAKFKV